MGLVAVALRVLGGVADVSAVADAVSYALDTQARCSAKELFGKCFTLAVKRHSLGLADVVESRDPADVSVDAAMLTEALERADSLAQLALCPNEDAVSSALAALLAPCMVLPGHRLADGEVTFRAQQIVRDAFADFFSRLPSTDVALTEVQLTHMRESAGEHRNQQDMLEGIRCELRGVASRQEELLRGDSYLDAVRMQQESSRPEHRNPFRIVKAEDFNHDYARLAQLFRKPWDYESIRDQNNLVIAGGRGCGKSMVLRSLSVRAAVEIERLRRAEREGEPPPALTFPDSGLTYFGVYIKLPRGYFYEWNADCKMTLDAATQLFQHVFNMLLLKSLVEQILDARDVGLLQVRAGMEREFVSRVEQLASWDFGGKDFPALLRAIRREENCIGDYVADLRVGLGDTHYEGCHTYIHNFIPDCCAVAQDCIPDLSNCRIYFLLDEYENLAEFQQKVVNTLAGLRPLSLTLKIATRALGIKSIVDLQGEPIQLPRDYHLVQLDYDVTSRRYRQLLLDIAKRRLDAEGFTETDMTALLEEAPPDDPASPEKVQEALRAMLRESGVDPARLSEAEWRELLHHWGYALVFRLCSQRRKPRTYGGFSDFVLLSSGIVSNFLEICKLAFYRAEGEGHDVAGGAPIPWGIQNEAVYDTSRAFFDRISRNIEDTGPAIARWVLDLADVFRGKLHGHDSEPEAARIVLRNPDALDAPENGLLSRLIEDATRWSVLHALGETGAYFPKHKTDVRSSNLYINRVLAPILRISPRPRWPTVFDVAELRKLAEPMTRAQTRRALLSKHGGEKPMPLLDGLRDAEDGE